jgi:hypothetical protein
VRSKKDLTEPTLLGMSVYPGALRIAERSGSNRSWHFGGLGVTRPSDTLGLPEKRDQAVPYAFRVPRVSGKLAPEKAFLDEDAQHE